MGKLLIVSLSVMLTTFSFVQLSHADIFSAEEEMDRKIKEEFRKSVNDDYISEEKQQAIQVIKQMEQDYLSVKREFDSLVIKGDNKEIKRQDVALIHYNLNNKVASVINKVSNYPSTFKLPVVKNYYIAKKNYYIFQLYYIQDTINLMKEQRKINSEMKNALLQMYSTRLTNINKEAASTELDFNNL